MANDLDRTPLYDAHVALGGRMVDFAGWEMPVQYSSIVAEHNATRLAVGLFDVSHMGRLFFSGSDTAAQLDRLVTRRVTDMKPGRVRYALVTNQSGGILDDVLVYRLEDSPLGQYAMVVNASNRKKIVAWLNEHLASTVTLSDRTAETAMIAVQGPKAIDLAGRLLQQPLGEMKYYRVAKCEYEGHQGIVSRTGYTGEDGVELIVPAGAASKLWQQLVDVGGTPAGLAARDTLRLEAAMPLYGHELNEDINPIQAGLDFAVNLQDRDFLGRDAIARFAADENQPQRVGLALEGRRPAREECPILAGEARVGTVTSGTFSPTLEKPIAMGYVTPQHGSVGTQLSIDIRGSQQPAEVVRLPFYSRQK